MALLFKERLLKYIPEIEDDLYYIPKDCSTTLMFSAVVAVVKEVEVTKEDLDLAYRTINLLLEEGVDPDHKEVGRDLSALSISMSNQKLFELLANKALEFDPKNKSATEGKFKDFIGKVGQAAKKVAKTVVNAPNKAGELLTKATIGKKGREDLKTLQADYKQQEQDKKDLETLANQKPHEIDSLSQGDVVEASKWSTEYDSLSAKEKESYIMSKLPDSLLSSTGIFTKALLKEKDPFNSYLYQIIINYSLKGGKDISKENALLLTNPKFPNLPGILDRYGLNGLNLHSSDLPSQLQIIAYWSHQNWDYTELLQPKKHGWKSIGEMTKVVNTKKVADPRLENTKKDSKDIEGKSISSSDIDSYVIKMFSFETGPGSLEGLSSLFELMCGEALSIKNVTLTKLRAAKPYKNLNIKQVAIKEKARLEV